MKEIRDAKLKKVSGGLQIVTLGAGFTADYLSDGKIRVHNSNTHKIIIFNSGEEYEVWLNNGGKSEMEKS